MSGFDAAASDRRARSQERAEVQLPAARLEAMLAAAGRPTCVLHFTAPTVPVSMNELGRGRGRFTYGKTRPWKAVGTWLAQDQPLETRQRIAHPRPILVHLTLPFVKENRRDPHNYFPTVKAVVDGLVQNARWVPDDTLEWVSTLEPTLVVDPDLQAILTIIDRP